MLFFDAKMRKPLMFSFGFEHMHVADRMSHRVAESDLQAGSAEMDRMGGRNFPTFRCDPIRTGPVYKGKITCTSISRQFWMVVNRSWS